MSEARDKYYKLRNRMKGTAVGNYVTELEQQNSELIEALKDCIECSNCEGRDCNSVNLLQRIGEEK